MALTITAFIQAGLVKEDDNVLGIMQGLDKEQASTICDWLALAAGSAQVRFMDILKGESEELARTREEVLARIGQGATPSSE